MGDKICGLVGIIGRTTAGLYARDLDLFEQGLVIDTLRGKDSVGAFTAFRNKQAQAIKHGSTPYELFKTKEWNEFRNSAVSRGRFVIGHNRAATRGDVNTDNAHPFVEENIILVHNGTLHDTKNITDKAVEVDSNAIAHALVEDTPENVFPKVKGAYACIWFNTTTQTLHMIRNHERPLFLMETKEHWMVASEAWIMAMPANRQSRKVENIVEIDTDMLYTFNMEGGLTTKKLIASSSTSVSVIGAGGNGKSTNTTDTIDQAVDEDGEVIPFFPTREAKQSETPTAEVQDLRKALAMKAMMTVPSRDCALTRQDAIVPFGKRTSTDTIRIASESRLSDTSDQYLKAMEEQAAHRAAIAMSQINDPTVGTREDGLTLRSPRPTKRDVDAYCTAKNTIKPNDVYVQGRVILFRVLRTFTDFKSFVRFEGKCMEPGMEMVDVSGYVPEGELIPVGTMCRGVLYFTQVSVHGPNLFITNTEVEEYTKVHIKDVPKRLWEVAFKHCVCSQCEGEIKMIEKQFTHVASKGVFGKTRSGDPINTLHVLCADCVEEKLIDGDFSDQFKAKRKRLHESIEIARNKQAETAGGVAAVQDGVGGSQESGIGPVGTLLLPGPTTLQ